MVWVINETTALPYAVLGGVAGAALAFIIVLALIFVLAFYIYFAIAWMTIGNKLRFKHSWLAWIPFARSGMILSLGGLPWPLVFLYLIPIFGWIALAIILFIAKWRIYEKRDYPGWLSLLILLPGVGLIAHAVVIGIVAWNDR